MEEIIMLKSDINVGLIKLKGKYFVYHLIKGDNVIYVGYSKNIYKRMKEHLYQREFDLFVLFPTDSLIQARVLERADIFTLNPIGNLSGKNRFIQPVEKCLGKMSIESIFETVAILNRNKRHTDRL